ncbi:MAG: zinc-ribbon domain-containing protein [Methanoregula sp.]|nr:zinc-ribbon domain-containing protein [Methanoregula sp.]
MPFCTSCGAEVAADKKFCEQCGAPMEPVTAPAATQTPAAPSVPVNPAAPCGPAPVSLKKSKTPLIIGGIVILLVIVAAVYFVGLPMLKSNEQSSERFTPTTTPVVTPAMMQTALPTPEYTIVIPEVTPQSSTVRDDRLEEDYEQIYTLDQKFAFGQKVYFDHELTSPPLYIRFNLTPTKIVRQRMIAIGTSNEHMIETIETSPNAWFEVKVLDAGSGAVIDQQGFGKDYPDVTSYRFMVRQKGNYRIEMSGNDVSADVQMLIGTP